MTTIPNPPERAATHTTIIPPENELLAPASKAIAKSFGRAASRFQVGHSPHGVARTVWEAKKIFRAHAPELAKQLIELALTAEDERVKSVCLIACLGNAGIKPSDYNPNDDKPETTNLDVSRLSPGQRAILRDILTVATVHIPTNDSLNHFYSDAGGRETEAEVQAMDARDISDAAGE